MISERCGRPQPASTAWNNRAQAGKTELDVKRYTPFAQEQAISQKQLDD
jgi:hypothetical protein